MSANFKWEFFNTAPNSLGELLPEDAALGPYLKVIDLDRLPGSPRLKRAHEWRAGGSGRLSSLKKREP
jgi:hypothetical protein